MVALPSTQWQSECGRCRLYCGDARVYLPVLKTVPDAALVTDPPYGIRYWHSGGGKGKHTRRNSRMPIIGDDAPFDPSPLFAFEHVLLWGADHLRKHLPEGGTFLAWDKSPCGSGPKDSFTDCEFAWTTAKTKRNVARFLSKGICSVKKGEPENGKRHHPTQKLVCLMGWCLGFFPDSKAIIDPYCGSGSTGIAAIRANKQFIGVEIDPCYFSIAIRRLETELASYAGVV